MTHFQKASLWNTVGDIERIYRGDSDWYVQYGVPPKALNALSRKDTTIATSILERCQRLQIDLLPFNDARYPEKLNNIHDPPMLLYCLGNLPKPQPSLAIVGAREPSEMGKLYAETFASQLAKGGLLIVSGMAEGIDAAAHRGALRAGEPTVAVLGCGVDIPYPKGNDTLYRQILENGAILSEYPPGTAPKSEHFPARNRIISGLCDGALIIQGKSKSGAGITANLAFNQGRAVFALPGRHDDPLSKKPNTLIKQQVAKLVDCADDILEDIPGVEKLPKSAGHDSFGTLHVIKRDDRTDTLKSPHPTPPTFDLSQFSPPEREVLTFIATRERTMEQLAAHFDMPINELLAHLTMLETYGAIVDRGGKTYHISYN